VLKYKRNLLKLLQKSKRGFLLLGPRQVGKSSLMAELGADLYVDLSDETEYLAFARNPREILDRLKASTQNLRVVIDEIQRLPSLLNTLQALIDKNKSLHFFLTGSSARKLRRGGANLLPGRILNFQLGPLVYSEVGENFSLSKALSTGTLPGLYAEEDQGLVKQLLRAYAATYLKEEIQAEALTKNLEGFSRFLFAVAACATSFLDIAKLAKQAQLPYQTAKRYFEIIEDTLILYRVSAFAKSERTRLIQHPRFFFFDNGVLNGLLENFTVSQDRKGMLFENFVCGQLIHGAHSKELPYRISTFRTESGAEVDFIFELEGKTWAIEAKSASQMTTLDTRGISAFRRLFGKKCEAVVAYCGDVEKKVDNVHLLPWQKLIKELGL
jgi:uncharacterized protein